MNTAETNVWLARWLDGVKDGSATMSQRRLSAVEAKGGGMALVEKAARARKLHLLVLEEDRGVTLVVASVRLFRVIC